MTQSVSCGATIGAVHVMTTSGRGLSAAEIAEMALARIISIADTAPPGIRDQALAFRDQLRPILLHYLSMAARSERTTLCGQLVAAGRPDIAEIVLKL